MTDRGAFVILLFLVAVGVGLTASPIVYTAENAVLPGNESRELADLDPAFRTKVEAVIAGMEDRGWQVWVRATRRDAARQAWYRANGWSQATHSAHERGLAADLLHPAPLLILPLHLAFFQALREEVRAAGLCSGGDYAKSAWPWKTAGLGWDPAHVEAKGQGGC